MSSGNELKAAADRAESPPLQPHILVVDDDATIAEQLERLFTHTGYKVTLANRAEQALKFLEQEDIDLVVTDIRLPGINGVELTKQIVDRWSDVPVIVVTGYGDIETAVEVLKLGASDFIVKPFSAAAIHESTRVGLDKARLFMEIRHLRHRLKDGCEFGGMLSRTPEMHRVFEIIRTVAPTDSTVVVEGETGTGKEMVASAIHYQSHRRDGPFVTINCGGFPEPLLESELFGYERGAFTGANQARPGKIEMAHGGTLFLDEIENMPLSMQVKLLLVLNNQRVQRLGAHQWTRVDMRIIAASNVPLTELVGQGKMRSDFYYRINVILIKLLPLRERLNDLPLLVQDFLRYHPVAIAKNITSIAPKALAHLQTHSWPGNIRELHNVLEKAVILGKTRVINASDLDLDPGHPSADPKSSSTMKSTVMEMPLYQWIREQEKQYLIHKLSRFQGRIGLTAKSCGMEARTLHRKMQLYGLDKKSFSKRI
ncbi:MAG TPA: sigma-54 dependent transcriptional regulator [Methylomirabilota bacterium]|jgi:DNA-binding NtrC family response regulator|nr:sigma-54 dependent transcriptional regulator [Methylomirabilota bacterium]